MCVYVVCVIVTNVLMYHQQLLLLVEGNQFHLLRTERKMFVVIHIHIYIHTQNDDDHIHEIIINSQPFTSFPHSISFPLLYSPFFDTFMSPSQVSCQQHGVEMRFFILPHLGKQNRTLFFPVYKFMFDFYQRINSKKGERGTRHEDMKY